jgi:hypothetical protein
VGLPREDEGSRRAVAVVTLRVLVRGKVGVPGFSCSWGVGQLVTVDKAG